MNLDIISADKGFDFARNISAQQVETTAKNFESLFLGEMVETMFGDSGGEEAFGSSESNEIYKGLMAQEYGRIIANSGGIGIADYIKRELLAMQESGGKSLN